MGLRPSLSDALNAQGYHEPTDVQAQAFPLVTSGRDLMVQSRTGTGKTLAFVLPLLERLDTARPGVQILVIVPTRELANQVAAVFAKTGKAMGVRVATLTGGAGYGDQLRALDRGAQVVVGTPGRLCDHLGRETLDLSGCTTVVLDEADEILDMGFQEDLEKLLSALPAERQSLMFSATLAEGVEAIARRYLRDPERLGLSEGMEASTTLTHLVYEVTHASKFEALVNLLNVEQPELAILFCHTKAETEQLSERLAAEGFRVGYLNGDLPQPLRTKTLEAFRRRAITLLVATDVAARGIDVRGITHVVNMGIPRNVETYIHRSGRTGRAGRPGQVVNLVSPLERSKMRAIVQGAELEVERRPIPQAADVRKRVRERFFESLVVRTDADDFGELKDFAQDLLSNLDPAALVAALLQDIQSSQGPLAAGYDVQVPSATRVKPEKPLRDKPKRADRVRPDSAQEAGMVRLRINVGKANRVLPGYLVRLICDRAQITGNSIGAIALFAHHSLVDVKREVARQVIESLSDFKDDRGRRWSVKEAE
jgi:ATP-dependent RNA helicase DeaD